jgi:NhaP-type Na+/H+ or K+/H+ antiporter
MLSMKKKNLGVGQGIPTLLIAASSIDDVLAISAYTVILGIAVKTGGDSYGW